MTPTNDDDNLRYLLRTWAASWAEDSPVGTVFREAEKRITTLLQERALLLRRLTLLLDVAEAQSAMLQAIESLAKATTDAERVERMAVAAAAVDKLNPVLARLAQENFE